MAWHGIVWRDIISLFVAFELCVLTCSPRNVESGLLLAHRRRRFVFYKLHPLRCTKNMVCYDIYIIMQCNIIPYNSILYHYYAKSNHSHAQVFYPCRWEWEIRALAAIVCAITLVILYYNMQFDSIIIVYVFLTDFCHGVCNDLIAIISYLCSVQII